GVSIDGVNFVPVSEEDAGRIDGTYLHFEAQPDGSTGWSVGTPGFANTHALIAAVEGHEHDAQPLADTFYYKVQDSGGNVWVDQITYALSDLSFDGVGPHTLGVADGE